MWTARLLVCYLHCVYATSVNISTETKHIFINKEENNWWDARENCKMEPERDLYISDTEFLPPVMENSLHSNTSYWVGAMRYSTWIWTEDGTPLYYYGEYSASPTTSPNNVSSNSVYECQLHCKTNRTVGLSREECVLFLNVIDVVQTHHDNGEKCYCLGNSYNVTKTSASGMQCPGNPDEMCGDAAGMSVYTRGTGKVGFKLRKTGRCAFGVKMNNTVSIELDYYYACITLKRRFAYYSHNTPQANCSGSVCVSSSAESQKQIWTHAHYSNDLIRLNDSTAISRTDPSHPTPDSRSAVDSQMGVSIGLAAGYVVFFLIVVTFVFLLQRERKLRMDRKDTNQQVNFNPSTENTTYDGLDVTRYSGAYSVLTPGTEHSRT